MISIISRFLFLCNHWLALEKEDGKTDRLLTAATKQEALQFRCLWPQRAKKHLMDDFLWVSVILRQKDDGFTRVQRLCCIAGLYYLTMLTCAMWFGTDDSVDETRGFNLGPLSFNLQSLVISAYSVLLVVPLSSLLLVMFKYSRKTTRVMNFQSNEDNADIGYSETSGFLQRWTVIMAYIMVAAIIICSSFVTLLYCMGWGPVTSAAFLESLFLSVAQSEGLLNPCKVKYVLLLTCFLVSNLTE